MADPAPVPGRALRLYQVIGVLALGWAAGRLPSLLEGGPADGPGMAAAPPAAAQTLGVADAAALASAVASQVASETVARLVAAGWGPDGPGRAPPPAPAPTVIALPAAPPLPDPAPPAAAFYILPPMGAAPAPAALAPAPEAGAPPPLAAAAAPAPSEAEAVALATSAYAALRNGQRAEAARDLSAALALAPDAPQAKGWAADLKALTRHWRFGLYAFLRDQSGGDPLSAAPLLGGSQTGSIVGYTVNPLGRRRVTAFARLTTGSDASGAIDPETSEAALGVRLDPFARLPVHVAIERRFALGSWAVNAWAARIAGGTQGQARIGRLPLDWDAYGEGGIVDFADPQPYVGAQGRLLTPILHMGRLQLDGGAGAWGSAQDAFVTSHQFDLGPTLRFRHDRWPVSAALDYRFRVIGNAQPGSGVAFTLAGEF